MYETWQTCPDCAFTFLFDPAWSAAPGPLGDPDDDAPMVVCPDCGLLFEFDPESDLPPAEGS